MQTSAQSLEPEQKSACPGSWFCNGVEGRKADFYALSERVSADCFFRHPGNRIVKRCKTTEEIAAEGADGAEETEKGAAPGQRSSAGFTAVCLSVFSAVFESSASGSASGQVCLRGHIFCSA